MNTVLHRETKNKFGKCYLIFYLTQTCNLFFKPDMITSPHTYILGVTERKTQLNVLLSNALLDPEVKLIVAGEANLIIL